VTSGFGNHTRQSPRSDGQWHIENEFR
jgi:hypothetical protein